VLLLLTVEGLQDSIKPFLEQILSHVVLKAFVLGTILDPTFDLGPSRAIVV